jgi:serine/threonine protein kinase
MVLAASFVVLAALAHLTHSDLAAAYRDPLVAGAGVLVLAAGAALVAAVCGGSTVAQRIDLSWVALAVLAVLWLTLLETHNLESSAGGRTSALVSIAGSLLIVVALISRDRNRVLDLGTGGGPRTGQAEPVSDLGSYRLLEPIGSGGMGEVWRATHQMLARQAAIKLVRPRSSALTPTQKEQFIKRFHREANAIAGLQSPNTIYIYDFGVASDGQFYYVMELVDGISLDALVKSFGPQPASRVRHLLRQICESLEEAHQRNLVHRDLKPSNIMLCKLALTHDFIKVLDFGLAKCAACEEEQTITVENVTAGTPGYIAPEIALAEDVIDGRADLYALGCVGYYLLTGQLVFDDANLMSMVLKHVQTAPVPPSQRTELPIPADLEQIVMACLEKAPAERPQSARRVAAMLDACRLDAWTEEQAAAWWEAHLPETSTLRMSMSRASGHDQADAITARSVETLARS